MTPPTFVSDRLEFELRLIPGVLAVGMEGGRLVITTTSALASGEADRFARSRLGDDVDVQVVTRATEGSPEQRLLRAVREVPGVNSCELRRGPSGGAEEMQVTVRSVRAGDMVQEIVGNGLGAAFVQQRLRIALEVPLLTASAETDPV